MSSSSGPQPSAAPGPAVPFNFNAPGVPAHLANPAIAAQPGAPIERLPDELLLKVSQMLRGSEIANVTGVSRSWERVVCAKDQASWKVLYQLQDPAVNTKIVSPAVARSLNGIFDQTILGIISQYAETDDIDYKGAALELDATPQSTGNALKDCIDWLKQGHYVVVHNKYQYARYFHKCLGAIQTEEQANQAFKQRKVIYLDVSCMPGLLEEGEWEWYIKNKGLHECTCAAKTRAQNPNGLPHGHQLSLG